jgi:hypothetical protein
MNDYQSEMATGRALPKLCGADIELGNFIARADHSGSTGYEASRALLAEIEGLPRRIDTYHTSSWSKASAAPAKIGSQSGICSGWNDYSYNLQDVSRRFLSSNGGSAYIDLNHVELCTPEVLNAFDQVAAWHGMLRIARSALSRANEQRAEQRAIQVLVNNSDGQGNSYGSHLSFLVSRRTFDNIFSRKPHYLQYLASFQCSNILLTGQGKVGSENGHAPTPFQLSQRADHLETLQGIQTTYSRPICNARDETLCLGTDQSDPCSPARLHVIFFDSALAHGSCLFRVGPMQLILTLIELGLVNPSLILDDPLEALHRYSRDPMLNEVATMISGQQLNLLELQSGFLEEVKLHAAQGIFEGIVPEYERIIDLWEDTLIKFVNRDWTAIGRRGIDWVLKLMAIERAMEQRPDLGWHSPEIKLLDHLYSSLDYDGLYWAYESSGIAEMLVAPEQIDYFAENPPTDTRAWTRAMLLRRALQENVEVTAVDWDRITFKVRGKNTWPSYRTLKLGDPLGFTQGEVQPFFESGAGLLELLDQLDTRSSDAACPSDVVTAN